MLREDGTVGGFNVGINSGDFIDQLEQGQSPENWLFSLEAEIRRITPLPIRYVLVSHAHVDEIGGNARFAGLGATIVGRDATRKAMLYPTVRSTGDGRAARQARPADPAGAPRITFETEMALHFNGQDIRLISVGRAHTDNDTIVVIPGLDVVLTGDVLRAHEYPSINRPDGGTLEGMLEGLSRLIGLGGPRTRYVTSHGQVVDRSVVVAQRDMLLTSRDRIAALMAQGKTVEEVVAAKVTEGLGAVALPGHVGADAFTQDVYAELKSGG